MHIDVTTIIVPIITIVYEIELSSTGIVKLIVIHRIVGETLQETMQVCLRIFRYYKCVFL